MQSVQRVVATPAALETVALLKEKFGALMFHQSGGCCDGSSPMCYQDGELFIGENDVYLGDVDGCPFYIGRATFEYWKSMQLILDVSNGPGSDFSLEGTLDRKFLARSRLFSDEECAALAQQETSVI